MRLGGLPPRATNCGPQIAKPLCGWISRASEYKPFLFEGFEAAPSNSGPNLSRSRERTDNLHQRWRSAPLSEPAMAHA
jgi:hypothetical protein